MPISRVGSIKIDEEEYLAIVRGKIRKDLRRYLGTGNVAIGEKDGGIVSVTVDEIEIPFWRFGFPAEEGVGEGYGEPGTELGPVSDEDGDSKGAGQGHGIRKVIIDLTPEEFAEYFQEVLELPRIKPKGDRTIFEEREKYSTLSRTGPRSLLHMRRTLVDALKRSIASGEFLPPDKTTVIPKRGDLWFKSYDLVKEPKNNAVVFFGRDVSGSMGPDERRVVSYLCDLCEFWLSVNYDRLDKVYIIHDAVAEEVARDRFFAEDWGGGTTCSTMLEKTVEIIEARYPVSEWNIYVIYLSDGFNFASDDEVFMDLLGSKILPAVNQFNYGQIELHRSWWRGYLSSGATTFSAPGTLGGKVEERFQSADNLSLAKIETGDLNSTIDAIKQFFKKGT